jgi:hypothetical protein
MRRTAALVGLVLLVVAVSLAAVAVDPYTILIGNNTDQACAVYLHYRAGDAWETRGWWTIEARKIGTLATSTDTEFYVFIQTPNGYYGTGDKRVTVDPYTSIEGRTYAAELPFSQLAAQVRQDEKGGRFFYAELTAQTQLRREVIYRDVYLYHNGSGKSITMSVHFQSLEGAWETTAWQKIGAGELWLACRTREAEIYAADLDLFVQPPRNAEFKDVKKGLFTTKFYGHVLRTGSPYPPVYIDIVRIFGE